MLPSFLPDLPIGDAVENILRAANEQQTEVINDSLRHALKVLAEHPERMEAFPRIAAGLPHVTAARGAGLLSVWLGGAVENGVDPDPAIPFLFETLLRWSREVKLPETDETGCREVEILVDPETLGGLEWIGQGLVAHLARSPGSRAAFAALPELMAELERAEAVSTGCLWVRELLVQRSGHLLVIHVAGRKGARVEYQNISNCFHLFTLLQGALAGRMPGAKRVKPEVLAIARGEADGATSDSAWWHFGPGTVPEANLLASIWGEMSPAEIPEVDGEQIVLLWPPQLASRSWDGGFFTPRLEAAPARVFLRQMLTDEQVVDWCDKLKLPKMPAKPWWKLW